MPGARSSRKLWDKGIPLDKEVETYTVGEDHLLDLKLVAYDCKASQAHARMLARVGLLKTSEAEKLCSALDEALSLHKRGKFSISREEEDCHTAIESFLIRKLGNLGKKIHTARSRNDQVLTALRLYEKDALLNCMGEIREFVGALSRFAGKYGKIPLPGYTHTRKAMPSSIRLWVGAFSDSMKDNLVPLEAALKLVDQSPLGTGAGYGIPLKLDRAFTAKALGFKKVQQNPIYAQNSRGKFESTILHAFTQVGHDLNKMATDLIWFSLPEFGYFVLPENFCTGSSIMPQKKNPDVLELVRANHHVVISSEFQVKCLSSNLISGYHRDLQLTKKALIEGSEITLDTLRIMRKLLGGLKVNEAACRQAMTAELYAAEEAYKLVQQGIPFRDAYKIIAKKF